MATKSYPELHLVRICATGEQRRAWAVFGPPKRSSVDLTRINVEFIAEPKGGTTTGQSASSTGKMRLADIAKNVVGGIFIVSNVHEVISSF